MTQGNPPKREDLVNQYFMAVHPIYLSCLDKDGTFKPTIYPEFLNEIAPYLRILEDGVKELEVAYDGSSDKAPVS